MGIHTVLLSDVPITTVTCYIHTLVRSISIGGVRCGSKALLVAKQPSPLSQSPKQKWKSHNYIYLQLSPNHCLSTASMSTTNKHLGPSRSHEMHVIHHSFNDRRYKIELGLQLQVITKSAQGNMEVRNMHIM